MNKITQAKNKKTNNVVFGIFVLLLAGSQMIQAQALPFYDGFDYSSSPTKLPGNGLWEVPGTGTGTNNDVAISTSSLNSSSGIDLATPTGEKVTIAGSGDDPTRIFTQQSTDGTTVYYSCLVNITDIGTASAGLTPNTANTSYSKTGVVCFTNLANETSQSTANLFGVLMVRKDATDPSKYNVGIAKRYDKTFVWDTAQYDINTTLFVVVSYQFITGVTNDICKLWVNPTCGIAEPTETVLANTLNTDAPDLNYFQIRQEGSSSPAAQVDEVRVGLTWADVTPAGTLGVKQNEISGLSMYPNPLTNGNLYITSNSNSEKSIAIFDVLGKEVLKTSTTNNAVNIASLKSGVYVVKITEEGKTDIRKLIIK